MHEIALSCRVRLEWKPLVGVITCSLLSLLLGCATAEKKPGSPDAGVSLPLPRSESGLDNFGVVQEGVLYRGAQPKVDTTLGLDEFAVLVSKYQVRTVVDLMNEPIDHWIARKKRDCAMLKQSKGQSLQYVGLPSYEPVPRRETLIEILRIVGDPKNQPVFLHCSAGANRTGAMIAGFRVVNQLHPFTADNAKAEMTQFDVLQVWQGINDRFIDKMARDRDAIRQEAYAGSDPTATIVTCGSN
jgi:hypothetical protein